METYPVLTHWIEWENCHFRMAEGGSLFDPKARFAFIDKTPRVRVNRLQYAVEYADGHGVAGQETDGWLYSYLDFPETRDEKAWCNNMLIMLGHDSVWDVTQDTHPYCHYPVFVKTVLHSDRGFVNDEFLEFTFSDGRKETAWRSEHKGVW